MEVPISPRLVQNITFRVERRREKGVLIGHSWVGDRKTGLVFGVVAQGDDWEGLEKALNEHLDDVKEHIESEGGSPHLIGLGSDYTNPPKAGRPETWVV